MKRRRHFEIVCSLTDSRDPIRAPGSPFEQAKMICARSLSAAGVFRARTQLSSVSRSFSLRSSLIVGRPMASVSLKVSDLDRETCYWFN